ncbi:programmed cell death 1 ligand 1-like isoform X2 [Sparus aurata]|uniref:programmed cell death 1 ligand 1-like isoform X2 n=1 Tax=Sparus aurata TaxID=8175 RepID=UPI0011C17A7B|nr:programmed cell death 1 ligand 1-like isoform X2 [Sparus aurata]
MSASVSALCLFYLCSYLLALTEGIVEQGSGYTKVVVEEGTDAVLPCMPSTKENIIAKIFDWKKDGQKDVFMYDSGDSKANRGQDQQFKGRVSHFPDELMNGNASLKIHDTKVTDSGIYSCIIPHLQSQTFNIELVVERLLRDRSGETPGASPRPYITTLKAADGQLQLQCEVPGASPKPEVQWLDSAGTLLPAEKLQDTERENHFYITVLTTVTKTDNFRCVATQEEIRHQTFAETYVPFSEKLREDCSTKEITGWLGGFVLGAAVLAAVQALLVATKRVTVTCKPGPRHLGADYKPPAENESNSSA